MPFELSSTVHAALLKEAAAVHPLECCGLLFGGPDCIDGFRPAANVHRAPGRRFEIDPATLIAAYRAERAGGPRIAGFYHSHPMGSGEPSSTDAALAAHDGRVWAIVAGGTVSLWRDCADGFKPLPYQLVNA